MTTSLEISKALKELGYPQGDGVFYWYYGKDYTKNNVRRILWNAGDNKFVDHRREKVACPLPSDAVIAAPTAEEILEKLPHIVKNTGLLVTRSQNGKEWEVAYLGSKPFRDTSLANAAAYCWLYLKEHNLL